MPVTEHFSVTTAAALIAGGVAAVVFAAIIARSSAERGKSEPARAAASAPRANAAPSGDAEYLLDVSDATELPLPR